MNRPARAILVALVLGIIGSTGVAAPVAAQAPVPRVALIVGPAGSATGSYRVLAERAAVVAERAGAEVVRVYSPDATWPAVRRAASGASIVVYLGHGNGWPSRYRDELYPPSQNGFGLNPVAGVDDSTHQYFGEASVGMLELAPNAVILLHHLCYASGNTEPGLPEGTIDQAIARVDNFAAGFIRAGASAVVAEAHMGPAWYVGQLLRGEDSIEAIWNRSPDARGNVFRVASTRSPGYTERLDPDHRGAGFYRSLVSRGVTGGDLRAAAMGSAPANPRVASGQPSLVREGIRFGEASLREAPVAGIDTSIVLPLAEGRRASLPKGIQLGIRWDPLRLDPVLPAAPPDAGVPEADASVPDASVPESGPSTPPPLEAPPIELVVPEQLGLVVDLAVARRSADGLRARVSVPATPGLYRLVTTIHLPSGVAYDAATQDLLTPLIVRVGGPVSVAYGAPLSVSMTAGSPAVVPVRVVNTGDAEWHREIRGWITNRLPASLIATWLSPDGRPVPGQVTTSLSVDETLPGVGTSVPVSLVAPATAGDYLLVLDVVSPEHGALSRLGSAPSIVRVSVVAAPAPQQPAVPATPAMASDPKGGRS